MNGGSLNEAVIAFCLPGHTCDLYSPLNASNMGTPPDLMQEWRTLKCKKGHLCSHFQQSYAFMQHWCGCFYTAGKLVHKMFLFPRTWSKIQKVVQKNADEKSHNFNLKNNFLKPAQVVKWPKATCDDFMNTYLEKILSEKALLRVDLWAGENNLQTMKSAHTEYLNVPFFWLHKICKTEWSSHKNMPIW
jgi:hypothetical protein